MRIPLLLIRLFEIHTRNKHDLLTGGKVFCVTGVVNFAMENNFDETYDAANTKFYKNQFKILDKLKENYFVALLAGESGNSISS